MNSVAYFARGASPETAASADHSQTRGRAKVLKMTGRAAFEMTCHGWSHLFGAAPATRCIPTSGTDQTNMLSDAMIICRSSSKVYEDPC